MHRDMGRILQEKKIMKKRNYMKVKLKYAIICIILGSLVCFAVGCSTGQPVKVLTPPQPRMSGTDFSIRVNKQIAVYTSQMLTHLATIKDMNDDSYYGNEIEMTGQSLEDMHDALVGVTSLNPPEYMESYQKHVVEAMKKATANMEQYAEVLEAGKDISAFSEVFQNDFNTLAGFYSSY